MQAFRSRWVFTSRLGSPNNDSTSTSVGTVGGHMPCALKDLNSDSATLVRPDNRDTAPLSSTSTDQPAFFNDASRIRLTIASACACWRALGSPTSAASSSM